MLALRSGIRTEQAFGLNHLVKISFERGDKYKFSQFSGLAEGLTEFALGVGAMFYEVDWTICNDPDYDDYEIGELDGINGTADILERIAQLKLKGVQDSFQPAEFTDLLMLITEAVLTIRNMVMLPDNAWYIADYPPVKDLLCILLNLPPLDVVVELKHCALDIAEQMTPYLILGSEDPLYRSLLAQLKSSDRGTILSALRAIGRIAMHHPTETNKLGGVPASTLQSLMDWLLLNDDELVDACLDFLYQYTAVVANLDVMLEGTNVEHLVVHLVRLLSHGAKRSYREILVSEARLAYEPVACEQVIPIPKDLQERLLAMEEPERCFEWLRCFFEEDPESQITQIAIWQAYNTAFLESLKMMGRPMINAPEFIRHISTVYQSAGAQVVREGANGESQKFIMRGIRPRPYPTTTDGRAYFQCQWRRPQGQPLPPGQTAKCGVWNLTAEAMWRHVLDDHLNVSAGEDGRYKNNEVTLACQWDACTKYPTPTTLPLVQFMTHIKTHLVTEVTRHAAYAASSTGLGPGAAGAADATHGTPTSASPSKRGSVSSASGAGPAGPKPRVIRPAKTITVTYEETASARDERNPNAPPQAAGIPLSAVLILRNIARNVVKTAAEEKMVKKAKQQKQRGQQGQGQGAGEDGEEEPVEEGGWNERLFRTVMPRLGEVFTENRLLAPYVTSLFQLLHRDKEGYGYGG